MRFRQFVAVVVLVGQAFAAWAGTPARAHCDEAPGAPPAPVAVASTDVARHPCGMAGHAAPAIADEVPATLDETPATLDETPAIPDETPAASTAGCAVDCCCIAFELPQGSADVGSPPSAVADARGVHRVPAALLARDLRPPIA